MFSSNREYKIVIIGLNNAGKTTCLYKLHLGEVIETQPTIGSNVEEVKYKNLSFKVWDLSGQESLRPYWATYFANTQAILMVVDSVDRERIPIVRDELLKVLSNDDVKRETVLLVYANKQDVKEAMTPAEISDALVLHSIKGNAWHIQGCCALTGEGLYEGLDWVASKINTAK